jgi:hypothetical protein
MLDMTTHDKNMMEVREELLHLIVNEDTRTILEAIIERLNEEGDDSERFKQLYDEVLPYIPKDSEYSEKYWAAAYVLYTNGENWQDFFEEDFDIEEYEDILNPKYNPGLYEEYVGADEIIIGILEKAIKNSNCSSERFKQVLDKMDDVLLEKYGDIDEFWLGDYKKEERIAMGIFEVENETFSGIIDELDTIQYELNKLEIDLWYAEAELYDAKNKEDKKAAKENVNKMKKRIEELKNRRKQILKVLDRITKKLVSKYLITE